MTPLEDKLFLLKKGFIKNDSGHILNRKKYKLREEGSRWKVKSIIESKQDMYMKMNYEDTRSVQKKRAFV